MEIWQLTVRNELSVNWEGSRFKGTVFIRASSVIRARGIASDTYGIAAIRKVARESVTSPWSLVSDTDCMMIQTNEFSKEGEEGILGIIRA